MMDRVISINWMCGLFELQRISLYMLFMGYRWQTLITVVSCTMLEWCALLC